LKFLWFLCRDCLIFENLYYDFCITYTKEKVSPLRSIRKFQSRFVCSIWYREILYIKLFPYTILHKSSKLAPLCIGNSSISNYFTIPGFPRSKCGYRRRGAFSVFLSKSPQKRRLFSPKLLAPMSKVCVSLLASSKTQNFTDYKVYHKLKTLGFKQYLA